MRGAAIIAVAVLMGCGGRNGGQDGGAAGGGSAAGGSAGGSAAGGASAGGSAAGGSVGGGSVAGGTAGDGGVATIRDALNCGTPLSVTGQGQAGELQLSEVNTAQFPDALCNDGTPPIIYFRPHRTPAAATKWVISLRGGGTCASAASCAARWCSCANTNRCPFAAETTNFNLNNMSGGGRRGQAGDGIMDRTPPGASPNPLADYNHVQLVYCSSDAWAGAARGVSMTTTHPISGQPVTYALHFLGSRILDADLRVLRQDGVAPLSYTLDGAPVAMPDLDDATEVVLAGDSAGGAGVVANLDFVAATLRANHTGCDGGASCPPTVHGLVDAVVGPDLSRLDWSQAAGADAGLTTWAQAMTVAAAGPSKPGRRYDSSCAAYHLDAGTPWACEDTSHVIRNHVSTPFFVRMALFDSLISRNYEELGVRDPVLGPFRDTDAGVPLTFAVVLQRELATFPGLGSTAEERSSISVPPGVFAPACSKHDTIHTSSEVYGVTITPDGGPTTRLLDVFGFWRDGGTPAAVLSSDPLRRDTVCP